MIALQNPREAYRRVDFDARIAGADPRELVTLCYEQLIAALGGAILAHERGDNMLKSQSLTRALSAITALQLGVSGDAGVSSALNHFYEAARLAVLDSVVCIHPETLEQVRRDVTDIAEALRS